MQNYGCNLLLQKVGPRILGPLKNLLLDDSCIQFPSLEKKIAQFLDRHVNAID